MLPSQALAVQRDHILALAVARGANGVRVFGSVAKGTDHEGSDVDLLVNLPAGTSLLPCNLRSRTLAHILAAPADIESFTTEGRSVFMADRKTQSAVDSCLLHRQR